MKGLSRQTGKVIEGVDYLKDRIESVLSMRINTSVMHRKKGSRLPELIDAPTNARNLFEMQLAALDAMKDTHNGLTDLDVRRVWVETDAQGKVIIKVEFATLEGRLGQIAVSI